MEFETDDPAVAEVSSDGVLTALSEGTAQITVTAGRGTVSEIRKTCSVTVKEIGDWFDPSADVYTISTPEQLFELSVVTNRGLSFADKTVQIDPAVDTLDLSGYANWLPIGAACAFEGVFAGNGKTISGLTINDKKLQAGALFAYTKNAVLSDFTLTGVNVNCRYLAAGVAALAENTSVHNVACEGRITAVTEYAGGIAGAVTQQSVIYNCVNLAEVSAKQFYAGGLAGLATDSSIINCVNRGTVNAKICGGICAVIYTGLYGGIAYGAPRTENAWPAAYRENGYAVLANCVNLGAVSKALFHTANETYLYRCFWLEQASAMPYFYLVEATKTAAGLDDPAALTAFSADPALSLQSDMLQQLNAFVLRNNAAGDLLLNTWSVFDGLPQLDLNAYDTDALVIWLNEDTQISLFTGRTYLLSAAANRPCEFTYRSADPAVASVAADGAVTGMKEGETEITVSAQGLELTVTLRVWDIGGWYDPGADALFISDGRGLYELAVLVNNGFDSFAGKTVSLTADIDLGAYADWEPIGCTDGFGGRFEGNRHTVTGLTIKTCRPFAGLFGVLGEHASVNDVFLLGADITGGDCFYTGAICAKVSPEASVSGCIAAGILTVEEIPFEHAGSYHCAGGICGQNEGSVLQCVSNVEICVNAPYFEAGGICGGNTGRIDRCANYADLEGSSYLGGICGYSYDQIDECNSMVSNCANHGAVTSRKTFSSWDSCGGICGNSYGSILNCVNHGPVGDNSYSFNGGLTGNDGGSGIYTELLDNCVNDGRVTTQNPSAHAYSLGSYVAGTDIGRLYSLKNAAEKLIEHPNADMVRERVFEFDPSLTLEDGTPAVDALNANADRNNAKTDKTAVYLRWHVDENGKLQLGEAPCAHCETATLPGRASTCTRPGKTEGKICLLCGEITQPQTDTPLAAHSYVEMAVFAEATCTSDGYIVVSCTVCGWETLKTIPALGHSFTDYVSDGNATCTADGTKTAYCDYGCGETDTVTDEGSRIPHSFTNYVSNEDATCTADGTKTAYCDYGCGEADTVTDEGSRIPHKFTEYTSNDDATCTADGTKTAYCDYGCGEADTVTDEGSRIPHSFTNYVYNEDATCTADGTKTAYCDYGCGKTDTVTDEGSALGHAWGGWTAFDENAHQRVCANDPSHTEFAEHVWDGGTVTQPATPTQAGEITFTCTLCGAVRTETTGLPDVNVYNIGDLDFDGSVTTKDARLALRAAVGLEHFDAETTAIGDVDFNGRLTTADARLILRAAIGLERPEDWLRDRG